MIGAWLAAAAALGAAGAFNPTPPAPPLALGIVAGAPPLVTLGLIAGSVRFRSWAQGLDLRLLTQLQMWRIVGFVLLVLGVSGTLPKPFALSAGIGDVIVALTAPLIASYAIGTRRRWIFLAWTVFGIADLVNAVALGTLTSTSDAMSTLPLSVIPTFGVPFALVLHLLSLTQLRRWSN
jgi:hypothetical protein